MREVSFRVRHFASGRIAKVKNPVTNKQHPVQVGGTSPVLSHPSDTHLAIGRISNRLLLHGITAIVVCPLQLGSGIQRTVRSKGPPHGLLAFIIIRANDVLGSRKFASALVIFRVVVKKMGFGQCCMLHGSFAMDPSWPNLGAHHCNGKKMALYNEQKKSVSQKMGWPRDQTLDTCVVSSNRIPPHKKFPQVTSQDLKANQDFSSLNNFFQQCQVTFRREHRSCQFPFETTQFVHISETVCFLKWSRTGKTPPWFSRVCAGGNYTEEATKRKFEKLFYLWPKVTFLLPG